MTRRIMPDHGKYRWTAHLCALVLVMAFASSAQAQRGPRLLGTPVAQPADSDAVATDALAADTGLVAAPLTPVADSRGAFPVERRMEMRSTAYCLRGNMRTGVRVRDGMAAGDPSVLPLGSVVRVSHPDGRVIGIFVIMDTGGAVRGNKIDLWFSDCGEASDWGTRRVIAEVLDIGRA
ncbi:3D domain-containing protein [Longimicrobium sp.]|uniref:3D domain-containing protein n=1 Tax=Longimicrobium sp. TaxID=2029185 RepID=UPI002E33E4B2|nr:3D domain-containing protein [Longimicrobium sp.]HEX6041217.1 3D domain-containing protein [Longimicrobium sp.]